MTCENRVPYYVARGFGTREVQVRCGTTDPYGGRALCDECERNPAARAEHERILDDSEADNAWLESAGWNEI